MLTSLFEVIKLIYFCINFNCSPIVKVGVGNSIGIWLGVKLRNILISTPLSKEWEELYKKTTIYKMCTWQNKYNVKDIKTVYKLS